MGELLIGHYHESKSGDILPVVTPPNPHRSTYNEGIHDEVACRIGRKLNDDGYDVAVDGDCGFPEGVDLPLFDNYPAGCGEEEHRRPDVYAEKGARTEIIEVETDDTISDKRTECQLKTFKNNGPTTVYVPEGYGSATRRQLRGWGIMDVSVKEFVR